MLPKSIDKATLAAAAAAGGYGVYSTPEGHSPALRGLMFALAGGTLGKITPGYREAFNEFVVEASQAYRKGMAEANAKVPVL